jgi:DNA-binding protein H-NS
MSTNNIRDLQKQLGQVNLMLAEAKKKERVSALNTIKDLVAEHDITELELLRAGGFLKEKKKRLPAKYYDPSTGKSWSGQGACPKWLADKNREDFLIRDEPKAWWPGED